MPELLKNLTPEERAIVEGQIVKSDFVRYENLKVEGDGDSGHYGEFCIKKSSGSGDNKVILDTKWYGKEINFTVLESRMYYQYFKDKVGTIAFTNEFKTYQDNVIVYSNEVNKHIIFNDNYQIFKGWKNAGAFELEGKDPAGKVYSSSLLKLFKVLYGVLDDGTLCKIVMRKTGDGCSFDNYDKIARAAFNNKPTFASKLILTSDKKTKGGTAYFTFNFALGEDNEDFMNKLGLAKKVIEVVNAQQDATYNTYNNDVTLE